MDPILFEYLLPFAVSTIKAAGALKHQKVMQEHIMDNGDVVNIIATHMGVKPATDIPRMAMMIPGNSFAPMMGMMPPQIDYFMPIRELTYAQIFESDGITQESILKCQTIARMRVLESIEFAFNQAMGQFSNSDGKREDDYRKEFLKKKDDLDLPVDWDRPITYELYGCGFIKRI